MEESAETGRDVAVTEAAIDTGELKSSISVERIEDGYRILSAAEHSFFLEWGTGRRTEPGAPGGPRRQTLWTYLHPRWGWVSTYGGEPQPFMRPGFDAGLAQFQASKRRRGL